MTSTHSQSTQAYPRSPGILPPPMMNPSDGSRPVHFGFFGTHPMEVNMHPGWEGATLHNGFLPRFKADGSTVMVPVEDDLIARNAGGETGTTSADPLPKASPSMSGAQNGTATRRAAAASKEDDVISISSFEDDGAKPCHIPGDSTYRAPGSQSRIKDGQGAAFTRVTRSKGKTKKATSITNKEHTKDDILTQDGKADERPKRPRPRKRAVKSKSIVMSSDENADGPENSQKTPEDPPFTQPRPTLEPSPLPRQGKSVPNGPEKSQKTPEDPPFTQPRPTLEPSPLPRQGKSVRNGDKGKGKRTRNCRTESGSDNPRPSKRNDIEDCIDISDSSDFSEMFSASELGKLVKGGKKCKESRKKLLKKINGLFRSSKRWRDNFLDLEAEEDDEKDESSGNDSEEEGDYDSCDSFIDDSDVRKNASDSETRKQEDAADPELPFPGLELEDFARQASRERHKQIEEDRCIARAITRHTAMVQSALEAGSSSGVQATTSNGNENPTSVSNAGPATVAPVQSGSKESDDHEMSSSEDEFGVKFYRAQFRDAIRRSRQAHERRLAEERNARSNGAASAQPAPSTPGARVGTRPPPPAYDSIFTSPLPPYTPSPSSGSAVQIITPPYSGNTAPDSLPAVPTTPSSQSASNGAAQIAVTGGQPRRLRFSWPERCEVTDPKLHDALLSADYGSLLPLRRGIFVPWSNAPGRGLVRFSAWKDQTPGMDPAKAFQALRFQRRQQFINPSRASPADLEVKEITGGLHSHSFRLHAYLNGEPAICVSSIYSESSCLRSLTTFGLPQNMLQGKLHTQEFERMVGFLCMSFGIPELHANLSRDSMHFVTRPVNRDGSSSQGQTPGMFSNNPSPSTKRAVANRLLVDHFALDSRNDVPIYDARGPVDFNFQTDLPSMASKLPLFSAGEIPFGSFVVVGYTASVYKANNGNWTLSCNIRWAIILGTAPGKPEE